MSKKSEVIEELKATLLALVAVATLEVVDVDALSGTTEQRAEQRLSDLSQCSILAEQL